MDVRSIDSPESNSKFCLFKGQTSLSAPFLVNFLVIFKYFSCVPFIMCHSALKIRKIFLQTAVLLIAMISAVVFVVECFGITRTSRFDSNFFAFVIAPFTVANTFLIPAVCCRVPCLFFFFLILNAWGYTIVIHRF